MAASDAMEPKLEASQEEGGEGTELKEEPPAEPTEEPLPVSPAGELTLSQNLCNAEGEEAEEEMAAPDSDAEGFPGVAGHIIAAAGAERYKDTVSAAVT